MNPALASTDGAPGAARGSVDEARSSTAMGDPAAADFDLDHYPFFLIAQIDHAYSLQMESALRSIRMNRPKWRVLMALNQRSPRSVGELAGLATLKLSTISRVVERMRREGLVTCEPRASDNRVTNVLLEEPGRVMLSKIIRVASTQYRRAVAGLADQEIRQCLDLLERIRVNLQRSPLE